MKNNIGFKLFIILIISILLRLWFIDKPEGLWNDEYVSWYIATKSNILDFFKGMMSNCHTPLYYLYIKFWLLFFPDTDYSLRISSVIPSLASVIVMFFVGKEFKNNNLGLLCAFLTAINSFCIYFAQEVRLYSLLFLFCSMSLLFFIRISKNQSAINYILFFLINGLICAVHTLGIIYSLFNIIFLFKYLNNYKDYCKDKLKYIFSVLKYFSPCLIILILLIPFWFNIAFSISLSQFWSNFSIAKIIFNFTDYFSPIQTNIVNTSNTFLNYALEWKFFVFGVLCLAIAVYYIYIAIKNKNSVLNYILLSCLCFFISLIIISLTGKMILITKYSCEILPALILAVSFGFMLLDKKRMLAYIFIFLNLFYIVFSSDSAPKRTRTEGHFAPVSLIRYSRLKAGDTIILTYYDVDKFMRYLNKSDNFNFVSVNKYNFNYLVFNNNDYLQTIKLGKMMYRETFGNFPNKIIIDNIHNKYLYNIKKGTRIGILILNTVSFFSNENIQDIIIDDDTYKNTPFIFLVFSTLKNNLLYAMKDEFRLDSITHSGDWTLFVYEKK